MDPLIRMIDANANRAREGLRVMEDVARFARNDAAMSAGFKALRHGVTAGVEGLGISMLQRSASRDTPGDVGTGVKVEGEGTRASLQAVVGAAGARATEALRVCGECAKLVHPAGASAFERLRYEAYELQRRLVLALGTGRGGQWRLCVLISEGLCKRPWLEVARAAIEGGADCLQLREKGLGDAELWRRAGALVEAASRSGAGVSVIVNDRADVALATGAAGVHLGQDDLSVAEVRAIAGDRLIVGVSTHNLDEAERAWAAGADYCGVGAMFATATKARPASGAEYLQAYLADERMAAVPHLAIGGITPGNVRELAAAGCRGVAVSGVVCGAAEPAEVCRAILAGLALR